MVIKIELTNGKVYDVDYQSERLEYLLGITAFVCIDDYDSNVKAINPITKEKVRIIKGMTNKILIPAHNKEDYDFAIENNIEIKQVVAKYFKGEGNQKVREKLEVHRRNSVIVIVENQSKDKILCLDCKGRDAKTFVLGGIEKDETPVEASLREIEEETGYKDIEITFVSNFRVINHFYADYKGVNRYSYLNMVFARLKSEDKNEISEEENAKHVVKWIDKKDVLNLINVANNRYAYEMFLNGETAYTDGGRVLEYQGYERMSDAEVRESIRKKLKW